MSDSAGTVYTDYIASQLTREEDRSTALSSRAQTVMTTSGALATLLLGFTTLTKKQGEIALPQASHVWIRGSLVAFAAAAILAIVASLPLWQQWASENGLRALIPEGWGESTAKAQQNVSENRLDILKSLRRGNWFKGWTVLFAVVAEGTAVALITVAVWKALPA